MKSKTGSAVRSIVSCYEKGIYTRSEMYHFVEKMIHDNDIDEIISSLPDDYGKEFVNHLSQTFGNRESADNDIIFIHDINDVSLEVTNAVRYWLKSRQDFPDTKE